MWIELHDSTVDHPKIIKVARDLKISRVQSLGHTISLWLWTLRMAPDGDLSSFDVDDIEIGAQWEGDAGTLAKSMIKRGLLDKTPDGLIVHDWQEYATHLKAAERKRKQRARTKEFRVRNSLSRDTLLHDDDVTACHADRQTDRQTEPNRQNRPTVAPSSKSSAPDPATPSLIDLPCTKGEHPVTAEDVDGWAHSYPGVDISQALRSMREWLLSNPTKKKTPKGMRRFITAWLDREQNKGGSRPSANRQPRSTFRDVTEKLMKQAMEEDRRNADDGIRSTDDEATRLLPERSGRS